MLISEILYEENNTPNKLKHRSDLEEDKMEDTNNVAEEVTRSFEKHILFGTNPENSRLENLEQQEEDVTRHTSVCEQRLRIGCKTALNLSGDSNNDSEKIQQDIDVSRINFQQEVQQPVDAVDKKLVELLSSANDEKLLTEDRLKKLNENLESDSFDIQETIDFLIRRGIRINYQDSKTKQSAIDIAWENGYYYSMLMLLEADSKFPQDFDLDSFYQDDEIPCKLKAFVNNRQNLHKWIQQNELKQVQTLSNHKLSKFFSNENKSALEIAAASANVEILAYLTNIQFPLREITLTEAQLELLKQVNEEDDTLLSIAAKRGKKDNVDFFIRCGIDVNPHNKLNKSAVDLAWENKHYDIVLTLLKADSDFPNNFDLIVLNEGNAQKELKEFVTSRNSLHKQIKENQLEDIKDYTDAFNGSKFYLNSEGQSAMFTAIDSKRFVIFAFLKFAGFMFKNEDEEECINKLSRGEKDMLKTEMIYKFPQIDEGHISYLISKSRSKKRADKDRFVELYRSLDDIPEVSVILKVIQYTDYLDIVFDFDNPNIKDMNPTASKATKGTTDYKDGRIYIAAMVEENKLLGTLAHELTHLAMYILYKNECNPFDKLENNGRQTFESITADIKDYTKDTVEEIDNNIEDNPLTTLARAFTYPEDEQQSELIVRIPHILAQYHDEGRKWLLNANKEIKSLFDYYTDQAKGGMAYRCKEFIENSFLIKPRNGIQVLNETFGEINEINNIIKQGINFEVPIDIDHFLMSNKQVFLMKTENTLLSILSIYESLIIKNKNYSTQDILFFKLNCYIEQRDEINKLFYSATGKVLCIRYDYDTNKERLLDVLKILNTLLEEKFNKKIIFVISESQTEGFNEIKRVFNNNCYTDETNCKFTLNDLTEESQQILLERKVIFQGEVISLNILIDKSDKNAKQIIGAKTLEELISNKVIEIGSRPLGTIGLGGAYSELVEEVNMKVLVDKLLSEKSNDIYIISGIPKPVTKKKLIEYLVNPDIDNTRRSKVNDLESRVAVINQDTTRVINNRILVAGDRFKERYFKEICQNNRERKVYWINLEHENSASKFMLQQIYNPDFYLKADRFNNKVVIEKNIKEQLVSSTLSETFVLGGKNKDEVTRWLQFSNREEQMEFERNYSNHKIRFQNSEDNMLNNDQTFHFLKFEQDQLIWSKTHGSLTELRKYISKDHENTKRLIGEDALITEIKDNKVVIIAGDPGMGKTNALVKLYELQYTLPSGEKESTIKSHWLITFNLKDHLDAIRDIDFTVPTEIISKITDFLSQVHKGISHDFAKKLLSTALVKQNFRKPVLIVLDGFDELLDEDDRRKVISLLTTLKYETKAKFWITTRLHYKQILENTLSTFAIKINPTGDESTNEFVKKYLKNHLSLILCHEEFQSIFGNSDETVENTRMQGYTNAFLSKMHEVFKGDVSKLIGTPLQLYLMLEGSTRYFKEWARHDNGRSPDFSYLGNDIWEAYETFVDRKYDIYFKKGKVQERLRQEQDKITFHDYHKDLTKSLILKSTPKQSLNKITDIILLAGIIRSDGNSIEFIHPTFRDYFAAKIFLNWIVKWKAGNQYKLTNSKKQEHFYQEILIRPNYQVIRTFLNNKLQKEKMPNIHLEEGYANKILLVAIMESNMEIIRFVIGNVDNTSRIVNAKYDDGSTVLHKAAAWGTLDILKFLVDVKGADFNAKDGNDRTVLHMAVASGNLDIVKFLVDVKGADVNAKDHDARTVLHMAVASGNLDIVKFLVDVKGADFNAKDGNDRTVLHIAVASGNLDILKFLVDVKGADVNAKGGKDRTVLYTAVASGNLDIVKFLVDVKGADITAKDHYGGTVLHEAVLFGNMDIVKFLVDVKGADITAKDHYGGTVLHEAVLFGNMDIVKFLVDVKGADFTAKDGNDKTVLHMAVASGNLDIVKFLVDVKGADFNAKDGNDKTVLHMAVASGNLDIVKFLVDVKGADFTAKDHDGRTVLHEAVLYGNMDIVKFLVNVKGADFTAKDHDGITVLHIAVASGNLDIVKFLVDVRGADFTAKDHDGRTVLHEAVLFRNMDIVKFLVDVKGADFTAKDGNGRTVLQIARRYRYRHIVDFLENRGTVNPQEEL